MTALQKPNVRALKRLVAGALLVCGLLVTLTAPASAHDPIFITADQTTPDTGPFMPDGSISWALYGSVLFDGDTRGFEFDLRDGDDLVVSLLIPNLSPELELDDAELPVLDLDLPDGSTMQILPTIRDVFDEPFSNTSYVTLAELTEPGMAGRYRGVVTGGAAARFSVAIGINEIFFTETERSGDRPSNFMEISEPLGIWYSTPPGEAPVAGELAEGEAEIQMDLIEDAMGSGEAEAPDEAVSATAADTSSSSEAASDRDADTELPDTERADTDVGAVAGSTAAATAATSAGDDGSSVTWIAPVAIGLLALLGAGAYLRRSS